MPLHNNNNSGVAGKEKKQTMAELKLRRLTELNARLREDLDRPRVKVSEACQSYVFHFPIHLFMISSSLLLDDVLKLSI